MKTIIAACSGTLLLGALLGILFFANYQLQKQNEALAAKQGESQALSSAGDTKKPENPSQQQISQNVPAQNANPTLDAAKLLETMAGIAERLMDKKNEANQPAQGGIIVTELPVESGQNDGRVLISNSGLLRQANYIKPLPQAKISIQFIFKVDSEERSLNKQVVTVVDAIDGTVVHQGTIGNDNLIQFKAPIGKKLRIFLPALARFSNMDTLEVADYTSESEKPFNTWSGTKQSPIEITGEEMDIKREMIAEAKFKTTKKTSLDDKTASRPRIVGQYGNQLAFNR